MECEDACIERLEFLINQGIIAIDDKDLILKEYSDKVTKSGSAKGTGDKFFIHVFNHRFNTNLFRRVSVTPIQDENVGFEELPENNFDPSDRMFLAVAVVADAKVLNATDSDWGQHSELINELEVEVEELCPKFIERKLARDKK